MTWWQYVQQHTPGCVTQGQIASRVGVDQTAVSRWKREGGAPAAHTVIEIARTLGRPPAEALVAAGHITPEEAGAEISISRIAEPTDDELVDLIVKRLHRDREDVTGHAQQPAPTNAAGSAPAGDMLVTDGEEVPDGEPRPGPPSPRPAPGSRRRPQGR